MNLNLQHERGDFGKLRNVTVHSVSSASCSAVERLPALTFEIIFAKFRLVAWNSLVSLIYRRNRQKSRIFCTTAAMAKSIASPYIAVNPASCSAVKRSASLPCFNFIRETERKHNQPRLFHRPASLTVRTFAHRKLNCDIGKLHCVTGNNF